MNVVSRAWSLLIELHLNTMSTEETRLLHSNTSYSSSDSEAEAAQHVQYDDRRLINATERRYRYGHGRHYLIMSVLMMFACCMCGAWWSLVCTIPAIFYSITAKEAEEDGDHERAEKVILTAMQLNLFAIVSYIISIIAVLLVLIIHFSLIENRISV